MFRASIENQPGPRQVAQWATSLYGILPMVKRALLSWFGTSTFRFEYGGLVVYLDTYMDRVEAAPPVGLSVREIMRADFVVIGHSHFDHLWGADKVALNTGATIVGSYETTRLMRESGVADRQLLSVAGGEPIRLADDVLLRVLPGQHSSIWARFPHTAAESCVGDLGVTQQERLERLLGEMRQPDGQPLGPEIERHLQDSAQGARGDGGALAYLIETPEGTLFWSDTSGYWTGVLQGRHADVAILAASGRGTIDGEPTQGTLADFIADEAALLRPRRVIPCHHDNFMPPYTTHHDLEPIRQVLAKRLPEVSFAELAYSDPFPIFE